MVIYCMADFGRKTLVNLLERSPYALYESSQSYLGPGYPAHSQDISTR